ncbi:zinc finger protein 14-like isoform X2 [Dendronephthya gigantea]|uniref:zinc finger protein 14-like isoform X2 n=1 Tax=Dendronephthya gigantea TaxID=151771 RepID=UPI00106B1253|nr:zinc finger protein 14-like isoform X2 [Dendronephthya gigantea]
MDGEPSKCRPSVIKWVGKESTPDMYSEKDKRDSSTVASGQPYEISQQEAKNSDSEQSTENLHASRSSESSFLESTDTEKKYDCTICKKRFKWRSHWKSHERIHTGERPFQCKICGKHFTRSDGLQSHKKVHIKIEKPCSSEAQTSYMIANNVTEGKTGLKQDKVYICAHCGRTFSSLRGYCRHTDKKHKGKEDLKCHICNTIFNRPSALKIHNRVHTGLKPYHCNICSKSFSIQGNLKRHLFIHSGERPYSCRYCSSCFNTSSHLARHVRSKHKN